MLTVGSEPKYYVPRIKITYSKKCKSKLPQCIWAITLANLTISVPKYKNPGKLSNANLKQGWQSLITFAFATSRKSRYSIKQIH